MNGVALLVTAAVLGVDYGWQPTADGQLEYIIQVEPVTLIALRGGQELVSQIDPYVRHVRRFRLRVGTELVPRRGTPPRQPPAPAAAAAPPPGVSFGWQPIDSQQLEFIIQISPERLAAMRNGEDLAGEMPAAAQNVARLKIISGTGAVPQQGLTTASAAVASGSSRPGDQAQPIPAEVATSAADASVQPPVREPDPRQPTMPPTRSDAQLAGQPGNDWPAAATGTVRTEPPPDSLPNAAGQTRLDGGTLASQSPPPNSASGARGGSAAAMPPSPAGSVYSGAGSVYAGSGASQATGPASGRPSAAAVPAPASPGNTGSPGIATPPDGNALPPGSAAGTGSSGLPQLGAPTQPATPVAPLASAPAQQAAELRAGQGNATAPGTTPDPQLGAWAQGSDGTGWTSNGQPAGQAAGGQPAYDPRSAPYGGNTVPYDPRLADARTYQADAANPPRVQVPPGWDPSAQPPAYRNSGQPNVAQAASPWQNQPPMAAANGEWAGAAAGNDVAYRSGYPLPGMTGSRLLLPWEEQLAYAIDDDLHVSDFWASLAETSRDPSLAFLADSSVDTADRPWGALTMALVGLFASLGATAYLAWIAVGMYQRYLELADELADGPPRSRAPLDDDDDELDEEPPGEFRRRRRRFTLAA